MEINNVTELDAAIALLENKKIIEEKQLRLQLTSTINSFKPANLIKAAYRNATEDGTIGSTLLKAAAGVGTTILGGKLLAGNSLIAKIAGSAIRNTDVAENVLQNPSKIFAWGKAIFNNVFSQKKL